MTLKGLGKKLEHKLEHNWSTIGSTIWRIHEVVYESTRGNESTIETTSTRKKDENENDKTVN
jgi:hypothetical protein